mmetsp:Transcript_577/g.1070  ORF Transcript_577/g.1070 Transcript_577/m.1070 type:complete len:217 (+) Transcript_577:80-730(+)
MTESYQYASIPHPPRRIHDEENGSAVVNRDVHSSSSPFPFLGSKIALSVLAALALVGIATYSSGSSSSSSSPAYMESLQSVANVDLEGAARPMTTPCTFEECIHSQCDHESAPYTCLFHNGGPHGGCSSIPWAEGTCTTQCDLSHCDSLDIPGETPSCKNVACPKGWCSGGQVCPEEVSFQCTGGSGTFGCSSDEYHWTVGTTGGVCTQCCDTTTC